jgi:hypothetical protein
MKSNLIGENLKKTIDDTKLKFEKKIMEAVDDN